MTSNKLSLKPLERQIVVITGATSGIGLATARAAAKRGAALFLIARNEEALVKLCHELSAKGVRVAYAAADVGSESELVAAADQALHAFGGWDTWINNAGVSVVGPVRETPIEDQRRLFETNYWGVVYGSLAAVAHLRRRPGGGALINVGSVLGDVPIPSQGVYSASKAAVKGFTDALRMEMLREGAPVSVTLVKPSAIDTPYKDHARNLTDTAIRNPPPVYDVNLVADAILYCAENRVRAFTVGGGGKLMAAFHQAAPQLAEPLLAWGIPRLSRDTRAVRRATDDALYEPGRDLQERSDYPAVRRTSVLNVLQMNPLIAVGAGIAVGALIGGVTLIGKARKGKLKQQRRRFGRAPVVVEHHADPAGRLAPVVAAAVAAFSALKARADADSLRAKLNGRAPQGATKPAQRPSGLEARA